MGMLFRPNESLYLRASFNCVEKIINLTQRNDLPSKSLLVAFATTAAKKALNPAEEFEAFFDSYLTQASLLFSAIIEKFRWSRRNLRKKANDMEWKTNDKTPKLLSLPLSLVAS